VLAAPHSGPAVRSLQRAGTVFREARGELARLEEPELQIAQLAAEGLTNKEIGQRLYLSHRTVSSHLHRIFPKLGVAARSELRMMVGILS